MPLEGETEHHSVPPVIVQPPEAVTDSDIDPVEALAVIDVELNEIELFSVGSVFGGCSSVGSQPTIDIISPMNRKDIPLLSFMIFIFYLNYFG